MMESTSQIHSQSDLPMMINFRGDEDIAKDFSFSAEQAMELLGIKRSRLNQISGRELRVARMRVDGYLRPIYRPSDVEEYLSWTRAPVTHKRSSEAIDDAVLRLENQARQIREDLENEENSLSEEISSGIAILDKNIQNQMQILRRSLQQRDRTTFIEHQNQQSIQEIMVIHAQMAKTNETQAQLLDMLGGLKGAISEILVSISGLSQRIDEQSNQFAGYLEQITDDIHRDFEQNIQQNIEQNIEQKIAQAIEQNIEQKIAQAIEQNIERQFEKKLKNQQIKQSNLAFVRKKTRILASLSQKNLSIPYSKLLLMDLPGKSQAGQIVSERASNQQLSTPGKRLGIARRKIIRMKRR